MSTAKRPAHDVFGSSQLVKRAKADANLGNSSAVAVVNGAGQNGALIQGVCRKAFYAESNIAEATTC
jgi:Prp8 binding protein